MMHDNSAVLLLNDYSLQPGEVGVVNLGYPVGDIRRYGAHPLLADNGPAINNAFLSWPIVSAPYATFNVVTPLSSPSTCKQWLGVGGFRGATILNFTGAGAVAWTIDADGFSADSVYVNTTTAFNSWVIGMKLADNRHFGTMNKVAINGSFGTLCAIGNVAFDQHFEHFGGWGVDNPAQVGLDIAGVNGNSIDFFGARFVHCGTNVWIRGGDSELVNFIGGENAGDGINAHCLYGVRIGDGSAWSGIECINFYGVYFEGMKYNIFVDQPTTAGINCYGCRNSSTTTLAHVFLNQSAESVNIIGGVYRSVTAGAVIVDLNNTDTRSVTICTPSSAGFGMQPYKNNGLNKWINVQRYGDAVGQESYSEYGIQEDKNFLTGGSFAGKALTRILLNGATGALLDHAASVVYDALIPSDPGSLWHTSTFVRGSICWNIEPASGVPMGWMCDQAGTPGRWKLMPNLL